MSYAEALLHYNIFGFLDNFAAITASDINALELYLFYFHPTGCYNTHCICSLKFTISQIIKSVMAISLNASLSSAAFFED